MPSKKLVHQLDKIIANKVKSKGYCVRCLSRVSLDCCHIIPRDYMITRFDEDNCLCMCRKCHNEAHNFPNEFKKWLECHLGTKKYEALMEKKRLIKKWTNEELIAICNQYTK